MKRVIAGALTLLSPSEKKQLVLLGGLVSLAALLETIGVASILPYMTLLTTPESAIAKRVFGFVSAQFGLAGKSQIITVTGLAVLMMVVFSTSATGLSTWLSLRFSMRRVHSLSLRILGSYLAQDYEFFVQRSSPELLKNLLSEVANVVGGVITPLIQMTTRIIVVILIVGLMLFVNVTVALISFTVFLMSYLIIYWLSKRALSRMGVDAVKVNNSRYQILSELFGGIREVKLWGKENYYYMAFSRSSERFANLNANNQLIALLPRYGMEIIAFGGMIIVTIILARSSNDFSTYLPMLALYAVAGYKLLPSLQQIYVNLASIRYSLASLDVLLLESKKWGLANEGSLQALKAPQEREQHALTNEIRFDQVTYRYPNSPDLALGPISIHIPAFSTVGVIGPSGGGKSTLLDVLLGLLEPTSGELTMDGVPITAKTRHNLTDSIGYVPQTVFLTDGSIAENIAFGTASKDIDLEAVKAAAKVAQIDKFIETLPGGYAENVGERGVRLSGGQRQRIAIARALYRNPSILVFDEATSALDSDTEEAVMEAVRLLAHRKTIVIVTHRLSTVRDCDVLYAVENGRLVSEKKRPQMSVRELSVGRE